MLCAGILNGQLLATALAAQKPREKCGAVFGCAVIRWADAHQIFRRLAATASSEPALACNVARACISLGRFAEAEEQVSVALQIDSEYPSAYELLATLHHLRDSPEAAELAKRAVDLEQSFIPLLVFALTRPAPNPPGALDALGASGRRSIRPPLWIGNPISTLSSTHCACWKRSTVLRELEKLCLETPRPSGTPYARRSRISTNERRLRRAPW